VASLISRLNMLKVLAIFIFLLPISASASFSDVSPSHENYDAIMHVKDKGIVKGYADGTYGPGNNINRAEFTKIVTLYKWDQGTIDACGAKYFLGMLIKVLGI